MSRTTQSLSFQIGDESVEAEPMYSVHYDGDPGTLTGLRLHGRKVYNGHLHGDKGGYRWCMPNVVDSMVLLGATCEEAPVQGEWFYAIWYP